jgi:hypothetical protein
MTTDVQILNDPHYQLLVGWEIDLNTMIHDLQKLYLTPKVDGNLTKGIETHMRISLVSVHNAMKQMRGEPL